MNKRSKPMNTGISIAIITTLLLSSPLLATSSVAEESSRYTMIETDNGIIRLDKQTGAMSNCKKSFENWSCLPMRELTEQQKNAGSEDQPADENQETAALRMENLKLKQRLADMEQLKGSPDGLEDEKKFKLPSDEEVDEAITYMEKMIRKFGGAMKRLREEQRNEPRTEL